MIYLVITIDVEPDCSLTWNYSNPLTFNGVKTGIKERLQPLFNKYGIVPTYLINNVVLEDDESIHVFQTLEGCYEIGTHLHPEFIEPEKTVHSYAGSKGEANCCHYSPDIETAKIENITTLFIDKFGYRPLSFRAGRFSAGENTFRVLNRLGYKVDTSVTPHVCWNDRTRKEAINYIDYEEQPYKMPNGILEVPVTIRKVPNFLFSELIKSGMGIRRPIRNTRNLWLRPVYSTYKQLNRILNMTLNQDVDSQPLVLNMMFHNVEVLPAISPYTKTEVDCDNYLKVLDNFLQICVNKNIQSVSLSELYEIYK